mgnify:CR=1 FL=1
MISDILFQYHSTSASNTLTVADLAFQADDGGASMVTSIFTACIAGNSSVFRIHHCGPQETPAAANCIILARTTNSTSIVNAVQSIKLILNPGDRLFCNLHSGSGIAITGYGLRPMRYGATTEPAPSVSEIPESKIIDGTAMPAIDVNDLQRSSLNSGRGKYG